VRILVVSNLYPPFFEGGYEIGCKQAVDALKDKGHEVLVLTSYYGIGKPIVQDGVHRLLRFSSDPHLLRRKILYKEVSNQFVLKNICRHFKPDIFFVWNLTHISVALTEVAQKMNIPVCYYVFDSWLSSWESDQWSGIQNSASIIARIIRTAGFLLGIKSPIELPSLHNAIFASAYLKDMAVLKGRARNENVVVWWGINTDRFILRGKNSSTAIRLLYVGQIIRHKGVHTIVNALDIVKKTIGQSRKITLTIVGDTQQVPEYVAELQHIIRVGGLEHCIQFAGKFDNEQLPRIYASHDIFVFASIWDEPFGITLLEAMASGLAVIGTATGGSAEILEDSINALVFEKDNPDSCASQIIRLINTPQLFNTISIGGRRTVEQKFRFDTMIDSLEAHLCNASKCC
jgi:glycosyltransferase involved in cell wall biosynthesis